MSGIVKGIGKVFKKVFGVLKKIAIPLLAIGAIVFTGGAALGLAPLAGGWGGAVASGLGAMGVNTAGTLGTILTGAVTQAGTGAAIGGLTSLATGGDVMKGMTAGALTGAVTGGVMSGVGTLGGAPNAAGGLGGTGPMPRPGGFSVPGAAPGAPIAGGTGADVAIGGAGSDMLAGGASTPPFFPATAPTATPVVTAPPPPTTGGLLGNLAKGIGNFAKTEAGGHVIAGIGKGVGEWMAAKDLAEAERKEQERITASYEIGEGFDTVPRDMVDRPSAAEKWGREGVPSSAPVGAGATAPDPTDAWAAQRRQARRRVRYNHASGRIEREDEEEVA